MTYVVTENCIRCKFMDCVEVCPVDCFYAGENMLVTHPDECIDCGVCELECTAQAIVPDSGASASRMAGNQSRLCEVLAEHESQCNVACGCGGMEQQAWQKVTTLSKSTRNGNGRDQNLKPWEKHISAFLDTGRADAALALFPMVDQAHLFARSRAIEPWLSPPSLRGHKERRLRRLGNGG